MSRASTAPVSLAGGFRMSRASTAPSRAVSECHASLARGRFPHVTSVHRASLARGRFPHVTSVRGASLARGRFRVSRASTAPVSLAGGFRMSRAASLARGRFPHVTSVHCASLARGRFPHVTSVHRASLARGRFPHVTSVHRASLARGQFSASRAPSMPVSLARGFQPRPVCVPAASQSRSRAVSSLHHAAVPFQPAPHRRPPSQPRTPGLHPQPASHARSAAQRNGNRFLSPSSQLVSLPGTLRENLKQNPSIRDAFGKKYKKETSFAWTDGTCDEKQLGRQFDHPWLCSAAGLTGSESLRHEADDSIKAGHLVGVVGSCPDISLGPLTQPEQLGFPSSRKSREVPGLAGAAGRSAPGLADGFLGHARGPGLARSPAVSLAHNAKWKTRFEELSTKLSGHGGFS